MKVSFSTNYTALLDGIFKKEQDIARLRKAISEGKGLLRPADDPLAWSRAMDWKDMMGKVEQWGKNINFGMNWNEYTESQLNYLNDLLTRTREIAIKAIKVNSEETRSSYVSELDGIIEDALSVSKSTYMDRYIFLVNENVDPSLNIFDPSTGDLNSSLLPDDLNTSLDIRVGSGQTMRINVDAKEIFFDNNDDSTIFNHIVNLREAIKNNDVDEIDTYMGKIEADQNRVLKTLANVGTTMTRLEARQNTLDELYIEYEDTKADLEQTDMTKIATDYQLKVIVLQALYQTTSDVSSLSLIKYL